MDAQEKKRDQPGGETSIASRAPGELYRLLGPVYVGADCVARDQELLGAEELGRRVLEALEGRERARREG